VAEKMKKAFTLIELVVAIALLGIVFLFAGTIFRVSIDAYRTAGANAEIMQKLRAITDQLNTDFKGIRTDAPLLFWFYEDTNDPNQRYDQIMFFADGDFQSTQLYDKTTGKPDSKSGDKLVIGNVARIHYSQARILDPNNNTKDPPALPEKGRLLAIRQHILTADPNFDKWPNANMSDFNSSGAGGMLNEWYEHDSLSLAQWKTIDWNSHGNTIVGTCFGSRPLIDMRDPNTFHKLMCEGVGSFTIQWAYWDSADKRFYWFPSDDPDGDGSNADSHFSPCPVCNKFFGVYFNIPGSISTSGWVDGLADGNNYNIYPAAVKFTFRLYDSKGIIKEGGRAGRTFTHIVYLGE
jgi:prepilin-type N-terminal cleavage/methylation domain-containing protein